MNPRNYLKGNAMFLPIHWIYDREYLKEVIIHGDIFNLAYQSNDYKRAKTSYDVYKNQVQGDTTTQGVIFKRLLDIFERQHTH